MARLNTPTLSTRQKVAAAAGTSLLVVAAIFRIRSRRQNRSFGNR